MCDNEGSVMSEKTVAIIWAIVGVLAVLSISIYVGS